MNTTALKNFAQTARTQLIEQVMVQLQRARSATGALRAGQATALSNLEAQINKDGEQRVVEDAAYCWFNRFVALRFMDVNDYADLRAVSPNDGETLPDLLQLAKARQLPDDLKVDHRRINDLIDRVIPSPDADAEVYRILLRAECNRRHAQLPFLFQRVDDFSELLLPSDLLSQKSLLHQLRETLTPDVCKDNEEVIGWLYQFYISEKKDAVFAAKGKVKKEDIPAVTQLFTPRWIVEYMVQNTLGKLWLQSHPDSSLRDQMPYYLESAETDTPTPLTDTPMLAPTGGSHEQSELFPAEQIKNRESHIENRESVNSPQDLTLADQACGSGHILLYAFELLTRIYEESGYTKAEIPHLILTHNLTGFEIDERAAQLAAFTLMMRARRYHRAALRKGSKPNIVRFQDLKIDDSRSVATLLADHGVHPGKELLHDLDLMIQATNLGSLIVPTASPQEIKAARTQVQSEVETSNDLFARNALRELDTALGQLIELGRTFWCVVDNPPYMGSAKMNPVLKSFVNKYYPDEKNDLMVAFMQRGVLQAEPGGYIGMINLPSWMFLSSFEKFRKKWLNEITIDTFLHLGRGIFGSDFGSCAFTFKNEALAGYKGTYRRLFDKHVQVRSVDKIEKLFFDGNYGYFRANQDDFAKIPGSPLGYWLSQQFYSLFDGSSLEDFGKVRQGFQTGDNNRYIKLWHEISIIKLELRANSQEDVEKSKSKFVPYNKGGAFRKWFGNNEYVVAFDNETYALLMKSGNNLPSRDLYFKEGLTWTDVSSGSMATRYNPSGFTFSSTGPSAFPPNYMINSVLGILNSSLCSEILKVVAPTIHFSVGDIRKIPMRYDLLSDSDTSELVGKLIHLAKKDWDTTESSWDFSKFDFNERILIKEWLKKYSSERKQEFCTTHNLEEINNTNVPKKYTYAVESVRVPLQDITILQQELDRKALAKLNTQLKRDPKTGLVTNYEELVLPFKRDIILQQFISYAVGCMMGRYSLDAEGLVLANAGDTLAQYAAKTGKAAGAWTFAPDEDGILPVLAGEYFPDDVVGEFRTFLRAAFGEAHFVENLAFVEECIGKDIRSYFVRDFYKDHVQRYKKRPIYWMFQSPGKHFRALVYLHRYRPDTVGRLLNDYLRPFIDRLNTERHNAQALVDDAGSSASASNAARKTIETANAAIRDCEVYQKDLLELARQRIDLDLDDGVLVNYNKMGGAVEVIGGVNDVKGRKKVEGFDWVDWDWGA
jgi:hypothetical protein